MSIEIIAVGRLKENYFRSATDEYMKRLGPYSKINIIEIPDEAAPENLSEKDLEKLKIREGEKILAKIKENSYVITLEIEGKNLSSEGFAEKIDDILVNGKGGNIVFIIGGSNGLSKEVSKRADFKLSFSKMTFPHQLMRVVLLEQIYRCFRIINNHPYHK